MILKVVHVFFIASLGFDAAHAFTPEKGKLTTRYGILSLQTHRSNSTDSSGGPASLGIGALAEADLDELGGLEVGLFYFRRTYQRVYQDTHIIERVRRIHIPVGYRRWYREIFSFGVAFSSSFAIGDSALIYNDMVQPEYTTARDIAEYGFDFSAQWECYHFQQWDFLTDFRYFLSLSTKPGEDANFYGIFLTARYNLKN